MAEQDSKQSWQSQVEKLASDGIVQLLTPATGAIVPAQVKTGPLANTDYSLQEAHKNFGYPSPPADMVLAASNAGQGQFMLRVYDFKLITPSGTGGEQRYTKKVEIPTSDTVGAGIRVFRLGGNPEIDALFTAKYAQGKPFPIFFDVVKQPDGNISVVLDIDKSLGSDKPVGFKAESYSAQSREHYIISGQEMSAEQSVEALWWEKIGTPLQEVYQKAGPEKGRAAVEAWWKEKGSSLLKEYIEPLKADASGKICTNLTDPNAKTPPQTEFKQCEDVTQPTAPLKTIPPKSPAANKNAGVPPGI